MCIELRKENDKPYNNSKIRYKWLRRNGDAYYSPYVTTQRWPMGEWCIAQPALFQLYHEVSRDPKDHGFHVYPSLERVWGVNAGFRVLGEFEVDGFMASGFDNGGEGAQTETWRKAKLLAITERK